MAAEAWRADQFPDLSPARTIHDAACLDGGLRIKGLRGEPTHWVPWDKIELISAGRIEAEDEYRGIKPPAWTSALSMGLRALTLRGARPPDRRTRAVRVPRAPVGEVIIVRRDPRIAFRIVENQMNYACLGDRLRPSAAENFPIFLADLCARAARATLTPPPARCSPPARRAPAPTPRRSSSPARRPCSITRPIVSSGAGTAATATQREQLDRVLTEIPPLDR